MWQWHLQMHYITWWPLHGVSEQHFTLLSSYPSLTGRKLLKFNYWGNTTAIILHDLVAVFDIFWGVDLKWHFIIKFSDSFQFQIPLNCYGCPSTEFKDFRCFLSVTLISMNDNDILPFVTQTLERYSGYWPWHEIRPKLDIVPLCDSKHFPIYWMQSAKSHLHRKQINKPWDGQFPFGSLCCFLYTLWAI